MRGQPSLRLILVVALFVLLALPVWRLTRPASAELAVPGVAAQTPRPASPKTTLNFDLTFAHPPTEFQLMSLGVPIFTGKGPGLVFHGEWSTRLPKEGVDLVLKATWPAETPLSAARLIVTYPDGHTVDKSFWGRGSLEEVVTLAARSSVEDGDRGAPLVGAAPLDRLSPDISHWGRLSR